MALANEELQNATDVVYSPILPHIACLIYSRQSTNLIFLEMIKFCILKKNAFHLICHFKDETEFFQFRNIFSFLKLSVILKLFEKTHQKRELQTLRGDSLCENIDFT